MATLLPLSDAQAAYIAGIIDGEGHIALVRSGESHNLRVVVKTTSKELAEWLVEKTGLGA